MNSTHVKASVASYFRYTRQYPLVCFERGLYGIHSSSNPDVITINKNRYLIEAEVKVTTSDMKNDAKKRIWKMRELKCCSMPYQFYYAVPYKMKDKALEILDAWKKEDLLCGKSGLLCVMECKNPQQLGFKDVSVIRKAPINKTALKLTVKEVITMVKHQTGTLCSLMTKIAKNQLKNKDEADKTIEYYI